MRGINCQNCDRGSANRRSALEHCTFPLEMAGPLMAAGIEEPSFGTSPRVDPSQVWAFVVIAGKAGQREIGSDRLPHVLLYDDVIDLKWSG